MHANFAETLMHTTFARGTPDWNQMQDTNYLGYRREHKNQLRRKNYLKSKESNTKDNKFGKKKKSARDEFRKTTNARGTQASYGREHKWVTEKKHIQIKLWIRRWRLRRKGQKSGEQLYKDANEWLSDEQKDAWEQNSKASYGDDNVDHTLK